MCSSDLMKIEQAMRESKPLPSLLSGFGLMIFVFFAALVLSVLLVR